MPATAGRVRMPHNNRVSGSAALNTSSVWKNIIKYDPYAGDKEEQVQVDDSTAQLHQGFMDVVKKQVSAMGTDARRGACRKCGNIGHLTFQCRNLIQMGGEAAGGLDSDRGSSSSDDDDDDSSLPGPGPDVTNNPSSSGEADGSKLDSRGRKRSRSSRSSSPSRRSGDSEEEDRRRKSKHKKRKKEKKSKEKKRKKEKKHKKDKRH